MTARPTTLGGSAPRRSGPPTAAAGALLPRLAIGLDAAGDTGLGVVDVDSGRVLACVVIATRRATWTQEQAIATLDELLGAATWCAAVEQPFGANLAVRMRLARQGVHTAPPSAAVGEWLRVLDLLARRRAERAGVPFCKPWIERPQPQRWRAPLGIRTTGDTKAAALAYVREVLRVAHVEDHNAAEGLCIAEYVRRLARAGGGKSPARFVR